jgi:hypothetical protein
MGPKLFAPLALSLVLAAARQAVSQPLANQVTTSWSEVTFNWWALIELEAPAVVTVLHVTPAGGVARLNAASGKKLFPAGKHEVMTPYSVCVGSGMVLLPVSDALIAVVPSDPMAATPNGGSATDPRTVIDSRSNLRLTSTTAPPDVTPTPRGCRMVEPSPNAKPVIALLLTARPIRPKLIDSVLERRTTGETWTTQLDRLAATFGGSIVLSPDAKDLKTD